MEFGARRHSQEAGYRSKSVQVQCGWWSGVRTLASVRGGAKLVDLFEVIGSFNDLAVDRVDCD